MKSFQVDGLFVAFHTVDCFISLVGIVANCVALFVFLRTKKLRSPENLHIISFTFAELMFAALAAPTTLLADKQFQLDISYRWCVMSTLGLKFYYCGVELAHLASISLIRLCRIVDPAGFRRRKRYFKFITPALLTLSWTIPAIYSTLPLIDPNLDETPWIGESNCTFAVVSPKMYDVISYALILPLMTMMVVIYVYICYRVHNTHLTYNGRDVTYDTIRKQKSETQRVRFFFVLLLFTAVCWMPVYFLYYVIPGPSIEAKLWRRFTVLLCHLNAAGNPFLYAFAYPDFTHALRMTCSRRGYQKLTGNNGLNREMSGRVTHFANRNF